MKLNDVIQVDNPIEERDEYGGIIETSRLSAAAAVISIKNDELRVRPSGLGHYRTITLLTRKGELSKGNKVSHNDVIYEITTKSPYKNNFNEVWIGHEV